MPVSKSGERRLKLLPPDFAKSQRTAACLCLIALAVCCADSGANAYETPSPASGNTSQADPQLQKFQLDQETSYSVMQPTGQPPSGGWPVILFLHGAGERGTDNSRQLDVGLGPAVRAFRYRFPCLVVFPQAHLRHGRILKSWSPSSIDGARIPDVLADVRRRFSVNQSRVALVGWSMGGYGALEWAAKSPETWSAVCVVSGGGETSLAPQLARLKQPEEVKKTRLWILHGGKDEIVRPDSAKALTAAVREQGGNAAYTELPNSGHEVWQTVFAEPAIAQWLLDPDSVVPEDVEFDAKKTVSSPIPPFHPAVVIPKAVGIRLGNSALKGLASGLPEWLAEQDYKIVGKIADIHHSIEFEGDKLDIQLRGIEYSAEVVDADASIDVGRINLGVALKNITLEVKEAKFVGQANQATTGDFRVVIGHRHPEWIRMAVKPVLKSKPTDSAPEKRWRIDLLSTKFGIENANWYVTEPKVLEARGPALKPEYVQIGLVGGLYQQKKRIETEIRNLIPPLLDAINPRLQDLSTGDFAGPFWPLPVYRPMLRLNMEEINLDHLGLSAVFNLAAAGFEGGPQQKSHRPPKQMPSVGMTLGSLPHSDELHLVIAPEVLAPLTQLMIDADGGRINVLDLPEPLFHRIANPAALHRAFPQLGEAVDSCDVEVALMKPFELVSQRDRGDLRITRFTLTAPQAALNVYSERKAVATAVSPVVSSFSPVQLEAALTFRLDQPILGSLIRPSYAERAFQQDWQPGQFPADSRKFQLKNASPQEFSPESTEWFELFQQAWANWEKRQSSPSVVDDLRVGDALLRCESVTARDGIVTPRGLKQVLDFEFQPPPLRLRNESSQPLEYQIRAPGTYFGETFQLKPGACRDHIRYRRVEIHRPNRPLQMALPGQEILLTPFKQGDQ